uniref:Uncharacterized protein n=1 Tax=Anguilla anguilla TaxID=7936 RepID=A0A0E9XPC9_ANGAN
MEIPCIPYAVYQNVFNITYQLVP